MLGLAEDGFNRTRSDNLAIIVRTLDLSYETTRFADIYNNFVVTPLIRHGVLLFKFLKNVSTSAFEFVQMSCAKLLVFFLAMSKAMILLMSTSSLQTRMRMLRYAIWLPDFRTFFSWSNFSRNCPLS